MDSDCFIGFGLCAVEGINLIYGFSLHHLVSVNVWLFYMERQIVDSGYKSNNRDKLLCFDSGCKSKVNFFLRTMTTYDLDCMDSGNC